MEARVDVGVDSLDEWATPRRGGGGGGTVAEPCGGDLVETRRLFGLGLFDFFIHDLSSCSRLVGSMLETTAAVRVAPFSGDCVDSSFPCNDRGKAKERGQGDMGWHNAKLPPSLLLLSLLLVLRPTELVLVRDDTDGQVSESSLSITAELLSLKVDEVSVFALLLLLFPCFRSFHGTGGGVCEEVKGTNVRTIGGGR